MTNMGSAWRVSGGVWGEPGTKNCNFLGATFGFQNLKFGIV